MANFPQTLAIGLWITGALWLLAAIAYLIGASTDWILQLFVFGVLTGIAEWLMRRNAK